MALQISTGMKQDLIGAIKDRYDGGVIRIFTGPQPDTAELPEQGTFLGEVTLNGVAHNGLVFQTDGPYLVKPAFAQWLLTSIANGTAGWFRCCADKNDGGGLSYSARRFDGAISDDPTDHPELLLEVIAIVAGRSYSLDSFAYTFPPILGA